LDADGNVVQTVAVGAHPLGPIFDGQNIWVPNSSSNSITVVRASTGVVVGTLTGNGLNFPLSLAFDGERMLATNYQGDSVSLWKATDLTPLGTFGRGNLTGVINVYGACS